MRLLVGPSPAPASRSTRTPRRTASSASPGLVGALSRPRLRPRAPRRRTRPDAPRLYARLPRRARPVPGVATTLDALPALCVASSSPARADRALAHRHRLGPASRPRLLRHHRRPRQARPRPLPVPPIPLALLPPPAPGRRGQPARHHRGEGRRRRVVAFTGGAIQRPTRTAPHRRALARRGHRRHGRPREPVRRGARPKASGRLPDLLLRPRRASASLLPGSSPTGAR